MPLKHYAFVLRTTTRIRETWDEAAAQGGDLLGVPARAVPQLEALFRRLGAEAGGDGCCVEIGCGSGRMTVELAARWPRVVALDVAPRALDLTRDALAARGARNVELLLIRGDRLDGVADSSADTVVCYGVLQHVPSRRVAATLLGETARVLSSRGEAFFQLPVLESSARVRLWRIGRAAAVATLGRLSDNVVASPAYRGTRFTDRELERALAHAGLRVVARADGPAEGDAATISRYHNAREVVLRLVRM